MFQIRSNIFETNSSSTHSLTICTIDEYDAFQRGQVLLNEWHKGDTFVTRDEAIKIIQSSSWYNDSRDIDDQYLRDEGFYTWDQWLEKCNWYEESFEQEYTTKNGEELMAFGYYGHD